MTKLEDLKSRLLEDPGFRKEYARVDEEFAVIEALIRARTTAGSKESARPGTDET